jgi:hypothetical protein
MPDKERLFVVTLPKWLARSIEGIGRRTGLTAAQQAELMLRTAMLEADPPSLGEEMKQEIKESIPDFWRGWRQIFCSLLRGKTRKRGESPLHRGDVPDPISLTLSHYHWERLQRIARARGVAAEAEASRLIEHHYLLHYRADTEEEMARMSDETAKEVWRIWRDIFLHLWSGKRSR